MSKPIVSIEETTETELLELGDWGIAVAFN